MSKPTARFESGEQDLFRSRFDQIIDLRHELMKLSHEIDWQFLESRFDEVYCDGPCMVPLPTRLMAGLTLVKYVYDLSDEVVCARFVENPYIQYFCGEEFFQHQLPLDRSSLPRWRQRMGEERMKLLLEASLSVAIKTGALTPADTRQVIVDTTVQPKNVAFPTDTKLLHRARERLVQEAWTVVAPELCACVKGRSHPASTLCACQTVQACQASFAQIEDVSWSHRA